MAHYKLKGFKMECKDCGEPAVDITALYCVVCEVVPVLTCKFCGQVWEGHYLDACDKRRRFSRNG